MLEIKEKIESVNTEPREELHKCKTLPWNLWRTRNQICMAWYHTKKICINGAKLRMTSVSVEMSKMMNTFSNTCFFIAYVQLKMSTRLMTITSNMAGRILKRQNITIFYTTSYYDRIQRRPYIFTISKYLR